MTASSRIVGLDLFAGAGGLSVGARMAGIRVACAVEKDRWAATTYARNHPKAVVINNDLRKVQASDLRPAFTGAEATVIFGGPPCSGFSTSNQRTRLLTNESNWLFLEFVRIVRDLMPDWVVFENVKGIRETAGGTFVKELVDNFGELGYNMRYGTLNAAGFGVPQRRERFFAVGSRHRMRYKFPEEAVDRPPTVRDALSDLPTLENGSSLGSVPYRGGAKSDYARQMRASSRYCTGNLVTRSNPRVLRRFAFVRPGGNWRDIPLEMMDGSSYRLGDPHTGIYHRLDENQPAKVIGNYRKNMLIHPWEHRGLSVREAARLQSFPDSFDFCGSIGFQQQQVGNAVPPLLAAGVLRELFERV